MEETKPIMLNLKESTKPLHDSTEQHEFQKQLGTGKISKDDYIKYLEQLFAIHSKLALALDKHKDDDRINAVVKDRHKSTANLENDILFLNGKKDNAIKATEKFQSKIDELESSPTALLGVLYVLEGSTHGAKYMASSLRKGLSLPERNGSSYFDRYQSEQMNFWLQFKKDMNELNLENKEEEKIIEAAKETFKAFSEIGAEILETSKHQTVS